MHSTGEGVLSCHELLSGKTIWQRNLPEDLNSKPSEYGMSSSPLLVDDMVVVQVGADQAAVVAADVATGKTVWTAGQGRAGYSFRRLCCKLTANHRSWRSLGASALGSNQIQASCSGDLLSSLNTIAIQPLP